MTLSAIVAMSPNRVIGREGGLPWHLPEDLKMFKERTTGHPIVMGRNTWESIGRPLPKRRTIIVSRSLHEPPTGTEVIPSLGELSQLGLEGEVFIIGGAQLYAAALPHCHYLYLTRLTTTYSGDTFFPPFEHLFQDPPQQLHLNADFELLRYQRTNPLPLPTPGIS